MEHNMDDVVETVKKAKDRGKGCVANSFLRSTSRSALVPGLVA